ncbi:DUF3180 domain-containing protein [Protaetiibacter intestinalis]|uniref:DUF3180 domain-containing protein n=1 Tax=Protaetiibacter intestinalis TaxID=2419774 RepID=A0A387BGN2_9MICO|nr:DUF3180 domain-containing protein [Protaetiibacter intestinalis]AYF97670.1 DUF3180 domain-containing protein [Protaetiibacter intestinalis]
MTRTRPGLLVVLVLASAIGAVLLQLGLASVGLSKIVPQVTLSVTLVLIAVIVVVLALPVRRATRGAGTDAAKRRVDPFYATRVLLIAKASAVAGALLGGAAVGLVIELLIRPVSAVGTVWAGVAMVVASVLLLTAGLVAEGWCAVPPDDEDKTSTGAHA